MNFLCSIVGHKPPVYRAKGWYSPGEEYAQLRGFNVDGCGRAHGEVIGECARCEEKFRVARIHLPGVYEQCMGGSLVAKNKVIVE